MLINDIVDTRYNIPQYIVLNTNSRKIYKTFGQYIRVSIEAIICRIIEKILLMAPKADFLNDCENDSIKPTGNSNIFESG